MIIKFSKTDFSFDQLEEVYQYASNIYEEGDYHCVETLNSEKVLEFASKFNVDYSSGVRVTKPIATPPIMSREVCDDCGEFSDECICSDNEYDGNDDDDDYSISTITMKSTLDDISKIEGVKSAILVNSEIVIATDDIIYKNKNFGKFSIVLKPDSYSINTQDFVVGYDGDEFIHPHIQFGGSPCLGSMSSTIREAVKSDDKVVLAILIMEFLKSVNEEDEWGRSWYGWPNV